MIGLRMRVTSTCSVALVAAAVISAEVFAVPSSARTISVSARAAPSGTRLGRDGVVSESIVSENQRLGTEAWRIRSQPASGVIEGFAGLNYAMVGQNVPLYVATSSASFRFAVFRMGYYGGAGARAEAASGVIAAHAQPPCEFTAGLNMTSCDNWHVAASWRITSRDVAGDYLIKLVGSDGEQSYIPFTVWNPWSHATYLVVARTLTEEGWNNFGGFDFYAGLGPCPPGSASYPVCDRARAVSLDRPYASGWGASDFFGNEYPLIFWAEAHGLDLTYVTDVTLSEHPGIALNHRAVVTLGHDETWTNAERLGAIYAFSRGVNLIFFGAAALVRHARLADSSIGTDRVEIDYRDGAADPLYGVGNPMQVTGNTWDSPPSYWPAWSLLGEYYAGYLAAGADYPLVVADGSSWLYTGTGLPTGFEIPGVVKSDIDHVTVSSVTPGDVQVLAHSPIPVSAVTGPSDWGGYTYSDATYWTSRTSRAGVFDSGTVTWIDALKGCVGRSWCSGSLMEQMTGNLMRLFGRGPAGRFDPSRSNGASIFPPGS
jgi:hypothetical protein